MRHGKSGNRLSRNQSLRKATLRDMAKADTFARAHLHDPCQSQRSQEVHREAHHLGQERHLGRTSSCFCDPLRSRGGFPLV